MEEIKVKKERKFLKVLGEIALTLFRELLLNMGKKVINKVGNKRQNLVIAFLMVAGISYASVDSIPYPITTNKQKLGWQTTGNGLVYRGRASDTITKPSNYTNKDIKAYLLVDTVNNVMYSYIASKGGWQFNNSDTVIIQGVTMPFDSITFNTANNSTVGVGEVEYNDTQGSLIQGLKGGNVTNVIGQQLHQRVNNRTGAPLAKGDVVYLSGSQGNRITVAKALATSDPTSANTFGIVAESIADNQSGYIITEGLITGLNTSFLTQDSAVYLSGTTAGALTSIKPQAPIHGVYIGVCVKTNAGSGEVFVKIRNGQELDELHDVQISLPFDNASLYYKSSDGLWRDTTAALLVSDTALMLTNYLRSSVAASTYVSGSGTTNYISKFTGSKILGNSLINDNGNYIGINKSTPTVGIDLVNDISSTSAKLRLQTNFANAQRTLELGSGDGLSWDLPGQTSQSPFIKVIGGDQTVGGGGLNLMTNNTSRLFIRQDGTIGIGTITPNATFEVHGSSVFNEGSTDSDFRVESDGNANMLFVDASTDRVGIKTNAPSKTLEVNGTINATGDITEGGLNVLTSADTASLSSRIDGKVSLTATESISGTKTFNNLVNLTSNLILSGSYSQTNKLLGKNSSDGVGNITVGSGLNLTSDILTATNPTEKYYFNLGIVAGAADNSASTYDFTYGSNIFIVPTSLNGYCIDTVHIRAIGCSTCPPVAGDKDYYVGVYKANAGARVTTSGATLVGSQITMNEYDLNEVNRNDTLSTGEAWWVYLNGTYTSDMAYVTAGFIVKKTCN